MKFVFLIVILTLACIMLYIPFSSEYEISKTVGWYKSHDKQRESVISECREIAGKFEYSSNCTNAKKADIAKDAEKRGGLKLKPLSPEDFRNN